MVPKVGLRTGWGSNSMRMILQADGKQALFSQLEVGQSGQTWILDSPTILLSIQAPWKCEEAPYH